MVHSSDICVLLHYLLKQKEILDAVHRYAVCIHQAVEFETQLPLGFGFGFFTGEATDGDKTRLVNLFHVKRVPYRSPGDVGALQHEHGSLRFGSTDG